MIVEKNFQKMVKEMDKLLKKDMDGKYLITTYQMSQVKYLAEQGWVCPFNEEAINAPDGYSCIIDAGCGSSEKYGCIAMTMGYNCSDYDEEDNPALSDIADGEEACEDFKEIGRRLLSMCTIDRENDYTIEDAIRDFSE